MPRRVTGMVKGWAMGGPRANTSSVDKTPGATVTISWVVTNRTGGTKQTQFVLTKDPAGSPVDLGSTVKINIANNSDVDLGTPFSTAGWGGGNNTVRATFNARSAATDAWVKVTHVDFVVNISGWGIGDLTAT